MAKGRGWLVSKLLMKDAEEGDYVVWLSKEAAYKSAAEVAVHLATQALENWARDDEDYRAIFEGEVIGGYHEGRYQESYQAWRDTADHMEPEEDVTVLEVPIRKG